MVWKILHFITHFIEGEDTHIHGPDQGIFQLTNWWDICPIRPVFLSCEGKIRTYPSGLNRNGAFFIISIVNKAMLLMLLAQIKSQKITGHSCKRSFC